MADDLLYLCAAQLLDVTVAALDDPPVRQFVHVTEPVEQCPHVAVWVRELAQATLGTARGGQQPGMPTTRTGQVTARLVVQVMRDCFPVFDPDAEEPDPSTIDAAARLVLIDRQDVWTALRAAAADGSMFAGILAHGRDGTEVSAPATISPQSGGGMIGSRFEVYTHLLRHEPAGS